MKTRPFIALLALVLTVAESPAPPIPVCPDCDNSSRSLVTGATFTRDGASATAYIIGQLAGGISPAAGTDPVYTVYRKDGIASAAGTYSPVGTMRAAVDPGTVKALLQRSWALRSTDVSAAAQEEELSNKLDQMFGSLATSAQGQPVSIKLANVIAAAMADPEYRADLELLGKTFPGINLCLGSAWAGPVPTTGPSTFEIRLMDPATGSDMAVVGRVTVDPSGNPTALPAPGAPVNAGIDVTIPAFPAPAPRPKLFASYLNEGGINANLAKAQTGFSQFVTQLQGQRVNRAVRLRWATPDNLRQRSVLHSGYNLYRVPLTDKTNPQWTDGVTNPSLAAIKAVPGAAKANTLPILNEEDLSAAKAADASDTETFFFTDQINENENLADGYKDYVYFVAAVDVLGREGVVSPGTKVTILNRMPPPTVKGVAVRNNYNWTAAAGGAQRFMITWDPVSLVAGTGNHAYDTSGELSYEIYRWATYDGARRSIGADPVGTVSGNQTFFADGAKTSPGEANERQTFWYTVRAVRAVNAGGNVQVFRGGHSAPVFGVIRDREGPGITPKDLAVPCKRPAVAAKPATVDAVKDTSADPGQRTSVTLQCARLRPDIAWVEFTYKTGPAAYTVLGRIWFGKSGDTARHGLTYDAATFSSASLGNIRCQVGTDNGVVSTMVAPNLEAFAGLNGYLVNEATLNFEANATVQMVYAADGCGQGAPFDPFDDLTGDFLLPIATGTDTADPGTREVKFYRRIDDGALTFFQRKEVPASDSPSDVTFEDNYPPPVNGGTICYYAQAYDVDGNAGPMVKKECVRFTPRKMPVPFLKPIVANAVTGKLDITWVCAPEGVDHFLVWISKNGEAAPASLGVSGLGDDIAGGDGAGYAPEAGKMFSIYMTSRVTGRFAGEANTATAPEAPAEFTIALPADSGAKYTVLVQARGAGASPPLGAPSNVRSGVWVNEPVSVVSVPWPQRPVPPKFEPIKAVLGASAEGEAAEFSAKDNIFPRVLETVQTGNFDGVGVCVGRIALPTAPDVETNGVTTITNRIAPHAGLFRVRDKDADAESLFPCALYRYRVNDAATDPGIHRDLVQVTPLMDKIAYGYVGTNGVANNDNGPWTRIYDRFIRFCNNAGEITDDGKMVYRMYLTDTLPVVSGATYRYLLVRFDSGSKEPKDVIPVHNPVTVP